MEILFGDAKLRELCEQQRAAERAFGKAPARRLRARFADLQAASCVTDLAAGHPHPLKGDRAGQLAIELAGGRRLVIEPAPGLAARNLGGSVAWAQVTAVRIVFIGDYHD